MGWTNRRYRLFAVAALFMLSLLAINVPTPQLHAATITVTTTTDEDSHPSAGLGCSLREAAIAASTDTAYGGCGAGGSNDVIVLGAGTYTVAHSSPITFDGNTSIHGASASATIIESSGNTILGVGDLTGGVSLRNIGFSSIMVVTDGSGYRLENIRFINHAEIGVQGSGVTVSNSAFESAHMYFEAIDSVADGLTANQSNVQHTGNRSIIKNITGNNDSEVQLSANNGEIIIARDVSLTGSIIRTNSDNGQVLIEDALISNVSSSYGQSILSSGSNSGKTILRNVTVEDGATVGVRHQVDPAQSHSLYVEDSIIRNNTDSGVLNNECFMGGTTLYVTNTLISGNSSTRGGGIYNLCGHVVLDRVTIAENNALEHGGGIFTEADAVTDMTNATIYGNAAGIAGGGIANHFSTSTPHDAQHFINSTIVNNTSPAGAAIFIDNDHQPVLFNVLIADNDSHQCDLNNTFHANSSNNMSTDDTCGNSFTEHDNIMTDQDLADNGGSAPIGYQSNFGNLPTLALLEGSPAINAGANNGCPEVDARNISRPQLSTCDIGAYEFSLFAPGENLGGDVSGLAPTGSGAQALRIAALLGLVAAGAVSFQAMRSYRAKRYLAK